MATTFVWSGTGAMTRAQATWLADGRRLHLHHGPIDMIVEAWGPGRGTAYARAVARFETVLQELVDELPRLRVENGLVPKSETARAMCRAIAPFSDRFITPMAAVAGAGADTILSAMTGGPGVSRAYVNNGGDIAFHIAPGEAMRIAMPGTGTARAASCDPVRGVATSGRDGRSHSRGIADQVTVLAGTAAQADAAATMIANAVDLPGHPAITRVPARDLSPDSDLGARLVTTHVGVLSTEDTKRALDRGAGYADQLRQRGLIQAAALCLRGETRLIGTLALQQTDLTYA